MLAFVSSNDINLIDFYCARQFRSGAGRNYPLSERLSHLLGIIFVDAQQMGDLAITQIQAHQIQPRDPNP